MGVRMEALYPEILPREATDGEKLQIGVRKASNSSESKGSGLGLAYGKLNGGFESGGIV